MQSKTDVRDKQLREAYSWFKFQERVDELEEWIREKAALMPEDLGRDVTSVESLLRQHEAFKSEITPIDGEVNDLVSGGSSSGSSGNGPDDVHGRLLSQLESDLKSLKEKSAERQAKIAAALEFQVFVRDYQTADSWLTGLRGDIAASELHDDLTGAEVALEQHNALKAEMDARFPWYAEIAERGDALVGSGHFASEEIGSKVSGLRGVMTDAGKEWEAKRWQLQQCVDLRRFEGAAARARANLERLESDLATTELGEGVDEVQVLQKTHASVAQRVAASADEVPGVVQACEAMVADQHYESERIQADTQDIVARRKAVEARVEERTRLLQESATMQAFLRDARDVEAWLAEKEQVVAERNYEDKTNLKAKLQRHKLLVMAMGTQEDVVRDLEQRAEEATATGNFAAEQLASRATALRARFEAFRAACQEKTAKLEESIAEQDFARSAADFDAWHAQVVEALRETDVGGDRIGAERLLKAHQHLMADVASKQHMVDLIQSSANALAEAGNYETEKIVSTCEGVVSRYAALSAPCDERLKALEDSVAFQTYLNAFRTETSWCEERHARAHATDVGSDPAQARMLLKKHQAFHAEVLSHEDLITATVESGDALVPGNAHSQVIYQHNEDLSKQYSELVDASSDRLRVLMENASAQNLFAACADAMDWCSAHEAAAASTEYGGDDTATAALLAKHGALVSDVNAHVVLVQELADQARGLLDAGNFEQDRISAEAAAIQAAVQTLQENAATRKRALEQRQLYHQFAQDHADSVAWLEQSLATARETDIGEDQDHCEVLREHFDDFAQSVRASEQDMVQKLVDQSEERSSHVDAAEMAAKAAELQSRLRDVQAAMADRRAQLDSATEVHTFVREAAELLARVEEKHGPALSTDVGGDLASAEAQQRAHGRFELSVDALRGAVEQQTARAAELAPRHPASAGKIEGLKSTLQSAWATLTEATGARKQRLAESAALQQFLAQQRYMLTWIEDMEAQIKAHEKPASVDAAEKALELHTSYASEVETRRVSFEELCARGQQLIASQPQDAQKIAPCIDSLQAAFAALSQLWKEVDSALKLARDVLVFEQETMVRKGLVVVMMKEVGVTEEEDEEEDEEGDRETERDERERETRGGGGGLV